MIKKRTRWSLIFSILFIHFMFAQPTGFPLTIAPFAIAALLFFHIKLTITWRSLIITTCLVFWPFIVLGVYLQLGGEADILRFGRTYSLWIYAIIPVILIIFSSLKRIYDYNHEFLMILVIVGIYSLLQVLSAKLFSSYFFYNPFGTFTYMNEYRIVGGSYERAPAFFLEPSFNAFIMFFLVSAILINTTKTRLSVWALLLGSFFVILSGSSAGILAMGMLASFWLIFYGVTNKFIRVLVVLTAPFILALFSSYILAGRLSEVDIEGTSGYWRLIAPLTILDTVLTKYPLGVPFGQIEAFVFPFGLLHGEGIGTSIDNGLYVIFFYFGWLAFPFFIVLIYKLFQSILLADFVGSIFWWFILASLQFSGGIFLPEYIYPFLLVLIQFRKARFVKTSLLRVNPA